MLSRATLSMVLAGVALLGAADLFAQMPANLLVIVADDLGPETVGCYQQPEAAAPTPVLDGLAANGLRFTRAYANPMCSPSRACLQTGRYAFRTGVRNTIFPPDPGLQDEEILLPEALAGGGHAMAMIGKWHLGYRHGFATPNVQGWPHFAGSLDLGVLSYNLWLKTTDGQWSVCTNYATTENVDDALAWIGNQQQPWMLLLCFNAPHWLYHAPPAHLHTFELAGLDPYTTPIPFYRAMVQAMDTEIGRLLQGLGTAAANTNVVFLADNGTPNPVMQAPRPLHGKGTLFEGGVLVPLIVSGPCVVNPGRVCGELVSIVDLYPTILELCGNTAPPPGIDGVSFVPLLQDQPGPIRPSAFNELIGAYSLTHQDVKLIRIAGSARHHPPHDELYDLVADPWEQSDLLAQNPGPAVLATQEQLSDELRTLRDEGWATTYGTACPGSVGIAEQLIYDAPRLGGSYRLCIDYPLPGGTFAIAVTGSWNDYVGGVPLPMELSNEGMPGCFLLTSSNFVPYIGPAGSDFTIPVPMDESLLWVSVYMQGLALDPSANALGLVTSAALRCVIGH